MLNSHSPNCHVPHPRTPQCLQRLLNKAVPEIRAISLQLCLSCIDILIMGTISLLERRCRNFSHEEALKHGRRLGAVCHRMDRLISALIFRETYFSKLVGKAFGPGMTKGQKAMIARGVWEHLGMLAMETLHSRHWAPERFEEIVTIDGFEHVFNAYKMNRGLLVVTGHYGNWEIMAGVPSIVFSENALVIMRDQPLPRLNRFIKTLRGAHLKNLYSMESRGLRAAVMEALARSETVIVLNDHYFPGTRKIPVLFFGKPAMTQSAPAYLAYLTGAPFLPVFVSRSSDDPTRHIIRFYQPALPNPACGMKENVLYFLSYYREALEEEIRRDPTQYLWTFDPWEEAG